MLSNKLRLTDSSISTKNASLQNKLGENNLKFKEKSDKIDIKSDDNDFDKEIEIIRSIRFKL